MLEAAPSASAGTALRKAMAESGIEPDAAVCTASHKLWLREGEVDKAAAALAEGVEAGRCGKPASHSTVDPNLLESELVDGPMCRLERAAAGATAANS